MIHEGEQMFQSVIENIAKLADPANAQLVEAMSPKAQMDLTRILYTQLRTALEFRQRIKDGTCDGSINTLLTARIDAKVLEAMVSSLTTSCVGEMMGSIEGRPGQRIELDIGHVINGAILNGFLLGYEFAEISKLSDEEVTSNFRAIVEKEEK